MTAEEQRRHQDEELPVTRPFKRRTARMHQSLIDAVGAPYIRSLRERIDSRETRTQGFDDEWGHEFDITIETRDSRHTQEIIDALGKAGYPPRPHT